MNWINQLEYVRGLLQHEMEKEVVNFEICFKLTQAISHIKDTIIQEERYVKDTNS